MPEKIHYLADLRANPGTSAEEVARRLQTSSVAAVESMFRKCGESVRVDDSKPRRYSLTPKGEEDLKRLESENASSDSRAEKLLERINASLARSENPDGEGSDGADTALLRELRDVGELPPWHDPRVREYYGLKLGMSDLPRHIVRRRAEQLAAEVEGGLCDLVGLLISREEALEEEKARFFGADRKWIERFKREIAALRRQLGCPEEENPSEDSKGSRDEDERGYW
jgi:hypothetical protein